MQLILIAIISLAIGAALGYFFQKSKTAVIAKELELVKAQQGQSRDESLKNIMLEVTREVSKELLDHHKRENKEAKEQAEKITQQNTEKLNKEFQTVVEKLAAVQGQNNVQEKKLSAIWQSLTSPVKASNFAEIGLENTLKNFGLEPNVDFIMQGSFESGRVRPDATIKLPGGNLMVIDAKTSKYFIEMAAAESDAEMLKVKLKASMNTHLKQLTERDYATAGKGKADIFVANVMYLPNDAAYAKVLECDGAFSDKCRDAGVLLVTPTSLHMLLSIATHQISRVRQEQNHQLILKEMGKVVSSIDVMLRQINKVGRAIHDSARHFSELSTPVNGRLIPRIRNVLKLGLEPENEVKMPETLPSFNIVENQPVIIDAEESVVEKIQVLEKKAS